MTAERLASIASPVPHEDATAISCESQAGAVVLQFADRSGGAASSMIIFNHGHGSHSGRNHDPVIVEPRGSPDMRRLRGRFS